MTMPELASWSTCNIIAAIKRLEHRHMTEREDVEYEALFNELSRRKARGHD